jgi:hypothetical protein
VQATRKAKGAEPKLSLNQGRLPTHPCAGESSVQGSRQLTGTTPRFWFWSSHMDHPSSYTLWRYSCWPGVMAGCVSGDSVDTRRMKAQCRCEPHEMLGVRGAVNGALTYSPLTQFVLETAHEPDLDANHHAVMETCRGGFGVGRAVLAFTCSCDSSRSSRHGRAGSEARHRRLVVVLVLVLVIALVVALVRVRLGRVLAIPLLRGVCAVAVALVVAVRGWRAVGLPLGGVRCVRVVTLLLHRVRLRRGVVLEAPTVSR